MPRAASAADPRELLDDVGRVAVAGNLAGADEEVRRT